VSFTTNNPGPTVSSVTTSATTTAATISWMTDTLSSSWVDFGPSAAYGSSTPGNRHLSARH
jgi:hypothetical protein